LQLRLGPRSHGYPLGDRLARYHGMLTFIVLLLYPDGANDKIFKASRPCGGDFKVDGSDRELGKDQSEISEKSGI
jgi:hypothetical protein